MKYTATLLAAGSMLAVASPSFAQDADPFTGLKVEALAGYDVSTAGSSIDDETGTDDDESIEGLAYGVGVGYDFAAGGVVLGIEGEYLGSTAETELDEGFGLGSLETGRDLYVGARVGFKANDDLMVYAKGGYTNATYNLRRDDLDNELIDVDLDGWRLGAGVEYALSGNTYAKVEYRYSNYSDAEIDFGDDRPDLDIGEVDFDRHQVMAGFGFRF